MLKCWLGLQLLRIEAQKSPEINHLLSTAQVKIVSRLKQLMLKLTAQQATLLIDEYETNRRNSSSPRKKRKLVHQVAEIIKQLETEKRLSKQLLSNFQTENSCNYN